MSTKMDTPESVFMARYTAGKLGTGDLVAYADRKLAEGVYSDHLIAILDERLTTWDAIAPLFELAIAELGLTVPPYEKAILELVHYHVGLIAAGSVEPLNQLSELWNDIDRFDLHKNIDRYVGDDIGVEKLYGLYFAVDELDDIPHGRGLQKIKDEIIAESKRWIENHQQYASGRWTFLR